MFCVVSECIITSVPAASPSLSVFYLGGSIEFSNLSFSPDLADPSSTQFRLQSQALSHYVSINIHNSLSVPPSATKPVSSWSLWNVAVLQRPLKERCSALALSNAKSARAAGPVVRSSFIVTLLNVNQALLSLRPLHGPLECKASCNRSPARCEVARWDWLPEDCGFSRPRTRTVFVRGTGPRRAEWEEEESFNKNIVCGLPHTQSDALYLFAERLQPAEKRKVDQRTE